MSSLIPAQWSVGYCIAIGAVIFVLSSIFVAGLFYLVHLARHWDERHR